MVPVEERGREGYRGERGGREGRRRMKEGRRGERERVKGNSSDYNYRMIPRHLG